MRSHKEQLDSLLEQFRINCHRTLEEYLNNPHPQVSETVMNSKNGWLARFIIAYEGSKWGETSIDFVKMDYARLIGWLNNAI